MYRVHLKITKVGIRIKENISIEAAIKKGDEHFYIPATAELKNCQAQLDGQAQFCIKSDNAQFEIYVLLSYNSNKKLVGSVKINLIDYKINTNNIVRLRLEQSPDSQSFMCLQLAYAPQSPQHKNNQNNLININGSQKEMDMEEVAKEIEERNENLTLKNTKLNQQLLALKKYNRGLERDRNQMSDDYEGKREEEIEGQKASKGEKEGATTKGMKMMTEEEYINDMEAKMGKLKELMDQHGGQDIRERVENIFKYS